MHVRSCFRSPEAQPQLPFGMMERYSWWLLALAVPVASSLDRIHVDGGYLKDERGRNRLFRGVNAVYKAPPWHPVTDWYDSNTSLAREDMEQLAAWGFNVVRLGVLWPGVEPEPGVYDEAYLATMRAIVEDLAAHGIYTIVDFHQDAFSQMYCGEGVPDWAARLLEPVTTSCDETWLAEFGRLIGQCLPMASYNFTRDPTTGFPATSECLEHDFTLYSRAPEVTSSWGRLFANVGGVRDSLVAYWKKVAEAFAGVESVLGYDLVNEPLNGDFFADGTLLEPGAADRRLLQPLYAQLEEEIRSADAAAILFFEPAPFPDTYPSDIPILGGVHEAGFTEAPNNSALSYHIYSCGFAATDCDRAGDTPAVACETCDVFAAAAGRTRAADAAALGGAAFLTEFGACSGSEACLAEISRVADVADAHFQSWAYWQFKYFSDITTVSGPAESFYDADGSLQAPKVAALRRTYAAAVAGAPASMRYAAGAFRLAFEASDAAVATEVVLDGRDVLVDVVNGSYAVDGTALTVVADSVGAAVDVAVVPAPSPTSGEFRTDEGDTIAWTRTAGTGVSLASNATWWKGVYVKADDGATVCSLETQDDDRGPKLCDISQIGAHGLLFDYTVEFWKAKFLGAHVRVGTMPASTLGPLLGLRVDLFWENDP